MNQNQIRKILQFKPSGFDPYVEQHREDGDSLEYTSWDKFQQQEHVDSRSVLPNEVVIDIDEGDTEERRDKTRQVCTLLQGLPYFVADTGGTGFHIHLFFQVPSNIDEAHDLRSYRMALFDWIRDKIDDEAAFSSDALDVAPVDFDTATSKGHLIRAVGGRHPETGHRKTKVTPSSLDKPEVEDADEVDYPVLDRSTDFIRMSKVDSKNADLSWSEVQNAAAEYQEKTEERREKQLETDYEAADDGLNAVRDLPADEVLKLLGRDVPRGRKIKCPCHDDNNPSARITDGTEAESIEPGLLFCWSGCVEDDESEPHKNNAIDILTENGYSFQEAVQELADEFEIDIEGDGDNELDMEKLEDMMQGAIGEDNPVKTAEKRREVFKRVVQVHPEDDDIQQEILNHLYNEFDVSKKDLEKSLNNARDERDAETTGATTEQTEQTEATFAEKDSEGEEGDGDSLLDKLASTSVSDSKRLIGSIGDLYYYTLWIERETPQGGVEERPYVLTSDDAVQPVRHRLKERRRELGEDESLTDDEERRLDYYYAETAEGELRFKGNVPQTCKQSINNLGREILSLANSNKEVDNAEALFDRAVSLYKDYWDHYKEEWFDVSVAYAIHTYLLPELGFTGYIMLHGQQDTGKTTWQKVNAALSYNGLEPNNTTPVTAVRYADDYWVTMHQDEVEKQSERKIQELTKLYNTGQREGGTYPITNMDGGKTSADQIQEINNFCAKTMSVNDQYGFDGTLLDRCVLLKAVRTNRSGLKRWESRTEEDVQEFREVQAALAYYVLKNREEIVDDINSVRDTIPETGREEDKMALFKGMISHFKNQQRAEEIEDHLRDARELQEANQHGPRVEEVFQKVKQELVKASGKMVRIRLKDIKSQVNGELDISAEDQYAMTSKAARKKLRDYDIMRRGDQKVQDSSGYTCVEVFKEEFLESCERYDLTEIHDELAASGDATPSLRDKQSHRDTQSAQSAQSEASPKKQIKKQLREMGAGKDGEPVPVADLNEALSLDGDVFEQTLENLIDDGDIYEPAKAEVQIL